MQAKDILNKLEKVERTVNVYSNETEDEVEEISIDIPLDRLKNIVTPKDDDPLLYRGYVLNTDQLNKINYDLREKIRPNFGLYYYVLECHGIYNW